MADLYELSCGITYGEGTKKSDDAAARHDAGRFRANARSGMGGAFYFESGLRMLPG